MEDAPLTPAQQELFDTHTIEELKKICDNLRMTYGENSTKRELAIWTDNAIQHKEEMDRLFEEARSFGIRNPIIYARTELIDMIADAKKSKSGNKSHSTEQDNLISRALSKAKKEVTGIENRTDLTDEEKVSQIIKVFSVFCAAIAVQPIPFADIFVLTPIQGYMGKKLADIRGYDISEAGATEIFKELAGLVGMGLIAQQLVIGAYKTFIPFLGAITTMPLVYGLTYGIGRVMDYYFGKKIKGEKINKDDIKRIFKRQSSTGKQWAKDNKNIINKKKDEL